MGFTGGALLALVWTLVMAIASLRISFPPFINIRVLGFNAFPGSWLSDTSPWFALIWLGSIGLAILSVNLFVAVSRSFCRNLDFSDGTTADFSGRPRQIIGWWIIWLLGGCRWSAEPIARIYADWILGVLSLWATIQVVRWFISHIELSDGRRFSFHGRFLVYLGWEILAILSVVTIIGWAWVLAAQYRWLARNTQSDHAALQFHGTGGEVLLRCIGALLFSLPILTIPWASQWYVRWLVENITIEDLDHHLDVAAA